MIKISQVFRIGLLVGIAGSANVLAEEPTTEMGKAMGESSKALKSLRTLPRDDFEAAAVAVRKSHEALLRSMVHTPALITEMPEGEEKQKALADARRLLGLSYAALCELEIAYLDKDEEKVKAVMSRIKQLKKEGHKKYTDD